MDTKKQANVSAPLSEGDFERIYAEEGLVMEVMEQLAGWMEDHQISRAELARRLGTSPANITQLLRGRNISLRTLASTVHVMGGVMHVSIREMNEADSYRAPSSPSAADGATVYHLHAHRPAPAVEADDGDLAAVAIG